MSGGAVTLNATADGATSYVFSFVGGPNSILGLPQTVPSGSGAASTGSIAFPANNTISPQSYTFRVVATGPGGTSASVDLIVVVPPTPQLIGARVGDGSDETASGEWWDRDAAMSTPDNAVWIYGDTSVFTKLAGPARGTHKRDDIGNTGALNGTEKVGTGGVKPGPYPGVPASALTIPGIRFWPKGLCYFRPEGGTPLTSDAFITFARVNYQGGSSFPTLGWGYAWRGNVYNAEYNTGADYTIAPRVVSGAVYGHRLDFTNWVVMERLLGFGAGQPEVACAQPMGLESHCVFNPHNGYYYCVSTIYDGIWHLSRSIDNYASFQEIASGAMTGTNSRNPYPHVTPFGIMVTWYDNTVHHTVGVLTNEPS